MADLTWHGNQDESFDNVENWRTAAGATPAAVPANNDNVYFTRRARFPCLIDGDQTAKDFDLVAVEPAYQFDVCTAQAPLICAADKVRITSAGSVFMQKGTGVFDDIRILGGFLALRNPNNASGVVRVEGGLLRIVGSGTRVLGDVTVDAGGQVVIAGTVTTLRVGGGTVILLDGSVCTTGTLDEGAIWWHGATFTTLVQNGGEFWDNSDSPPATNTHNDGLYSFARNTKGETIDLAILDAFAGVIDLRTGYGNVGTSGATVINHSATQWFFDPGRKITLGDA